MSRRYALASALALLPCFWQSRIQAGDLSSHAYNAWLAGLIEQRQITGLRIAPQGTNVLFDVLLSSLFRAVGPEAAQRIAVAAAVLVLFWGAFAFVAAISGKRPWPLLPCLAVLAYGWVFHMGFFNFYISLGLCFWAGALAWRPSHRAAVALPVLLVAGLAHMLPVAWIGGMLAYAWIARRVRPRRRVAMVLAALAALIAVGVLLMARFPHHWSPQQAYALTGADQAWVFGPKYFLITAGLLCLWGGLWLRLVHARGVLRTLLGIPFQLWLLSAAAVLLLPSAVLLPGFRHSLVYIPERMSLAAAVLLCGLLGRARSRAFESGALAALALAFFALLYVDERAINRFEDRMELAVAPLPQGQRVISAISDSSGRVDPLAHVIDRVCIGKCFSYANYEPSTAQFRIRAEAPNAVVVYEYADSYALQSGTYILKPGDLPLYQVRLCGSGEDLCVRSLEAGGICGNTLVQVMPELLPAWRAGG